MGQRSNNRKGWSAGGGGGGLVAVTNADTTPDFLNSKLNVGSLLSETVLNVGGNESLVLDVDMTALGLAIAALGTPDYLTMFTAGGLADSYLKHGGANEIEFATTSSTGPILNLSTSLVGGGSNLKLGGAADTVGQALGQIDFDWNGGTRAFIRGVAGPDTANKDEAGLEFHVSAATVDAIGLKITYDNLASFPNRLSIGAGTPFSAKTGDLLISKPGDNAGFTYDIGAGKKAVERFYINDVLEGYIETYLQSSAVIQAAYSNWTSSYGWRLSNAGIMTLGSANWIGTCKLNIDLGPGISQLFGYRSNWINHGMTGVIDTVCGGLLEAGVYDGGLVLTGLTDTASINPGLSFRGYLYGDNTSYQAVSIVGATKSGTGVGALATSDVLRLYNNTSKIFGFFGTTTLQNMVFGPGPASNPGYTRLEADSAGAGTFKIITPENTLGLGAGSSATVFWIQELLTPSTIFSLTAPHGGMTAETYMASPGGLGVTQRITRSDKFEIITPETTLGLGAGSSADEFWITIPGQVKSLLLDYAGTFTLSGPEGHISQLTDAYHYFNGSTKTVSIGFDSGSTPDRFLFSVPTNLNFWFSGPGTSKLIVNTFGGADFFSDSAEGVRPTLSIYGFRTGDSLIAATMGIYASAADTFKFSGPSQWRFNDTLTLGSTASPAGFEAHITNSGSGGFVFTAGNDMLLQGGGATSLTQYLLLDHATGPAVRAFQDLYIGAGTVGSFGGNYAKIDSAGKLTFAGTGGFYPVRKSQSAAPTPAAGEMMVWRDSDDNKTYIVYNDANEGVRKVEMT